MIDRRCDAAWRCTVRGAATSCDDHSTSVLLITAQSYNQNREVTTLGNRAGGIIQDFKKISGQDSQDSSKMSGFLLGLEKGLEKVYTALLNFTNCPRKKNCLE